MKANSIKIQYPEDTNKMEIVLSMTRNNETIQKVSKLREVTEKDKLLKVDIKQYRKKRSLDANAYCWILSQKIAEVIGNTKEYVYKPYAWRFINKKIKTKAFKSDESFNVFMNAVKNNKQIWNWQYKLLYKMYKGD